MKRRLLVLGVLVLSFFAVSASESATTSACDCWCNCAWIANVCYENCARNYTAPFQRKACEDQCFWEYETCTWQC